MSGAVFEYRRITHGVVELPMPIGVVNLDQRCIHAALLIDGFWRAWTLVQPEIPDDIVRSLLEDEIKRQRRDGSDIHYDDGN